MYGQKLHYAPPGAIMVFVALFLALGWGGYAGIRHLLAPPTALDIYNEEGMDNVALAMAPPGQTDVREPEISFAPGVGLVPRADFEVTGLVLGVRRYRWDNDSDVSPVDFALGWGAMSVPEIVENFRIRQGRRFYFWSTDSLPITQREVVTSSANMHMIPATDEIRDRLLSVRDGDVVRIRGKLVDVKKNDFIVWRSSLTRNDSGAGACEVIHVVSIEILRDTDSLGLSRSGKSRKGRS